MPALRQRVLVVGTEEALLATLRDELEERGFDVDPAVTAEEAIRKVSQRVPDVVVLDLPLRGRVDVSSLLGQLRQSDITRGIPVVVLCNVGDEDIFRKFLNQHADAYYTKTRDSLGEIIEGIQTIAQRA